MNITMKIFLKMKTNDIDDGNNDDDDDNDDDGVKMVV